jgi:hypothetical protein
MVKRKKMDSSSSPSLHSSPSCVGSDDHPAEEAKSDSQDATDDPTWEPDKRPQRKTPRTARNASRRKTGCKGQPYPESPLPRPPEGVLDEKAEEDVKSITDLEKENGVMVACVSWKGSEATLKLPIHTIRGLCPQKV